MTTYTTEEWRAFQSMRGKLQALRDKPLDDYDAGFVALMLDLVDRHGPATRFTTNQFNHIDLLRIRHKGKRAA